MKVYISLPITGHCIERCRQRADTVKSMVEAKGHEAVTPFDICPDGSAGYNNCMGRDIEGLMGCDAIFLLTGWSYSRGCQLEWRCAEIYGKRIFHHISELDRQPVTDNDI